MNTLIDFPEVPESQIKSMTLDALRSAVDKNDQCYFSGAGRCVPDHVYDIYKKEIKLRAPGDIRLHRVGKECSLKKL